MKNLLLICLLFCQFCFAEDLLSIKKIKLSKDLKDKEFQLTKHTMDVALGATAKYTVMMGTTPRTSNSYVISMELESINGMYQGRVQLINALSGKVTGNVFITKSTPKNLIKDVRFAVTEILLGKKYAEDNREKIEGDAKKVFAEKKPIVKQEEKVAPKIEPAPVVEVAPVPVKEKEIIIKTSNSLKGFISYGEKYFLVTNIVKVKTQLSFAGFGIEFKNFQVDTPHPREIKANIGIARPNKKTEYNIPMWKHVELTYSKKNYLSFLNFVLVGEIDPIYFVSLPILNDGLKLFESTCYWAKGGLEISRPLFSQEITLGVFAAKSLSIKSNPDNYDLKGNKLEANLTLPIYSPVSTVIKYHKEEFTSSQKATVTSSGWSAFLNYHF
jgi:hypothetical protein